MYNPLSEWGVWEVVVCGRVVEGRRRRTVPRTTADSLDNRLSVTAGAVDHAQSYYHKPTRRKFLSATNDKLMPKKADTTQRSLVVEPSFTTNY